MASRLVELILKIKADQAKKELADLDKASKKTSSSMGSSFANAGTLIKAAMASAVVFMVGRFIKLAGEIDTVSSTFEGLAETAGKSSKSILESIQTATRGTVSNLDIMKSANLAMSLMGEQVIDKLPKMAVIAMAAARLQGTSVKKMLEDIVVATGRQSVMILDNLGISSATAAKGMREYAAGLGKTRQQLTDVEKKQAFFYATMQAGNELVKRVDMSTLTFGERLQILQVRSKNLRDSFAQKLIPAFEDLVEIADIKLGEDSLINQIAKVIKGATISMRVMILTIASFPIIVKQVWDNVITSIHNSITTLGNSIQRSFIGKFLEKRGITFRYRFQMPSLSKEMEGYLEKLDKIKKSWEDYGKSARKGLAPLKKGLDEADKSAKLLKINLEGILASLDRYLLVGLPKTLKSLEDVYKRHQKNLDKIRKAGKISLPEYEKKATDIKYAYEAKKAKATIDAYVNTAKIALSGLNAIQEKQAGKLITSVGQIASIAGAQWGAVIAAIGLGVSFLEEIRGKNKDNTEELKKQEELQDILARREQKRLEIIEAQNKLERQKTRILFDQLDLLIRQNELSFKDPQLRAEANIETYIETIGKGLARLAPGKFGGLASATTIEELKAAGADESYIVDQLLFLTGEGTESLSRKYARALELEALIKKQKEDIAAEAKKEVPTPVMVGVGRDNVGTGELLPTALAAMVVRPEGTGTVWGNNLAALEAELAAIGGSSGAINSAQEDLENNVIPAWESLDTTYVALDGEMQTLNDILSALALTQEELNDTASDVNAGSRLLELSPGRAGSFVDIGARALRGMFGGGIQSLQEDLQNITMPEGLVNVAYTLGSTRTKSVSERTADGIESLDGKADVRNELLQSMLNKMDSTGGASPLAAKDAFMNLIIETMGDINSRAI